MPPPDTRLPPRAAAGDPHAEAAPLESPEAARNLRARAARDDSATRRRLIQKLRTALNEGGFVLHFQPIVHLKSGRVRSAEAMIRMQHRRRGLIPPASFMPVAERHDIIDDVGAWMLHEACRTAARWPGRFGVSLNVAHRQLRSGQLMKHVIEALAVSGLDAGRLELELSEAMLIDGHEETSFSLQAVRALGIGVALDNFGAGYASLSILRRLPLTTLKLDRSVLSDLKTGQGDAALPRAMIEAAHARGCKVVADGVETEVQCRLLDEMGCDEAQGPYFAPALSQDEIMTRFTG